MSSSSNEENRTPGYYRLDSEVVEKASTSSDERHEYLAVPSSSPRPRVGYQGSCSPAHSSSKADSEVGSLSDGELEEQGDVDEGFDEEFEEKDLNESENNSHQQLPSLQMEELDPKELQQLLGVEPDLAGLEDFDLGVDVDVLDNDQGPSILSPLSLSDPASHTASPSHIPFTLSPPRSADIHVETMQREERNREGPISLQSYVGGCEYVGNCNAEESTVQYSEEKLALLVSECRVVPEHTAYDHSHLMELAETFVLVAAATVLPPATDPPSTDLHSMFLFGNGSGQLGLPPNATVDLSSTAAVGHMTDHMTIMADSSLFPTLDFPPSPPVNTELHGGGLYRQPSPVGSPLEITSTFITTTTPPPSPSLESNSSSYELIDMQYYKFKKFLDDPTVPGGKKEMMKNIRRKGKNKVAAKACRQKKVDKVKGLEQEIEQLRKMKLQMTLNRNSLEREITQLKRQCHHQV